VKKLASDLATALTRELIDAALDMDAWSCPTLEAPSVARLEGESEISWLLLIVSNDLLRW